MTDKDLKFTTAEDFVDPPKYKLEDGTEYKPGDTLKLEEREYHQSTHYINKHIEVDDVIEEFGSLQNFEKGLYFNWNDYSTASDEDKKLADDVQEFVSQLDYERHEDTWTINKGGFDVDSEIVQEFTMEDK